jgi:acyl carrier protein
VTDSEILDGIVAVARRHLDLVRPIGFDTRLAEDLELDSIQLLTLAVEVENRFQVCLDPEADASIATVRDLVDAVRGRLDG